MTQQIQTIIDMVIFVGDRPSKRNQDPSVAFVGTPSMDNLTRWIPKLQVFGYRMINSYTHDDHVGIAQYFNMEKNSVFVALGNNASKILKDMGIPHFKLPHPSPRNRMLNNKKFIDSELEKCKDYIRGLK